MDRNQSNSRSPERRRPLSSRTLTARAPRVVDAPPPRPLSALTRIAAQNSPSRPLTTAAEVRCSPTPSTPPRTRSAIQGGTDPLSVSAARDVFPTDPSPQRQPDQTLASPQPAASQRSPRTLRRARLGSHQPADGQGALDHFSPDKPQGILSPDINVRAQAYADMKRWEEIKTPPRSRRAASPTSPPPLLPKKLRSTANQEALVSMSKEDWSEWSINHEQDHVSSQRGTKRKDVEAAPQDSTAAPAKRAKGQPQTTSMHPMITRSRARALRAQAAEQDASVAGDGSDGEANATKRCSERRKRSRNTGDDTSQGLGQRKRRSVSRR